MRLVDEKVAKLAAQRDEWEPPEFLHGEAAAVWRETVSSVSPEHFAQGDVAALARFCQTEARARKLARAEAQLPAYSDKPEMQKRILRVAKELTALRSLLATQTRILRLGPSGRIKTERASTAMPTRNPRKTRKAADKEGFDLLKG
jgi:hypothetical protein